MWSSTPSTPSTIPIDDRWARSVSSQDISLHQSEFYCPSAVFSDNFLQKLTTIPIPEKEDLKEREDEDSLCVCAKRELGRECVGWDFTRSRLRSEAADRKQLPKDFLLSKQPWYVLPNENADETDPLKRYYCMPKICVELGNHVVHYKKIIEYLKNGIFIFLIDLRYGTAQTKLKILKHIHRALDICNMISSTGITVAIGYQITGRYLKTGLVKYNADVFLDQDSKVILTADRKYSDRCSHQVIYANVTDFVSCMITGDVIQIGERIKLLVLQILLKGLHCKVVQEGLLMSAMPVKLPIERTLKPIDLTSEEEEDLLFAIKQKADFIVCPCAYKPKLIHYIRWLIASYKWEVKTFAKIVMTYEILMKDVDLFTSEYSGVWIQGYLRGSESLFAYLIDKCYRLNKLIVRSLIFNSEDMRFDSMEMKKRLFLYADCISTPASAGIHPVKMKSFIRKTYPQMNEDTLNYSCKYFLQTGRSIEHIFLRYAHHTSVIEPVTCIIMLNNSGKSVSGISRKRPLVPIIANVCDAPLSRSLMLLKNVFPLRHLDPSIMNWEQELGARLECCIDFAKSMGFVRHNVPFMVCYDSQRGKKFSDTYRILYVE